MTENTTSDYIEHTIDYYNQHTGRLAFHIFMSLVTGGVWAFCLAGWLLVSMWQYGRGE